MSGSQLLTKEVTSMEKVDHTLQENFKNVGNRNTTVGPLNV